MSEWYYSRNGKQQGPVARDELERLAATGQLNPAGDLLWSEGMTDWQPAGSVAGLFGAPAPVPPPAAGFNPYAASAVGTVMPTMVFDAGGELPVLDPPAPLSVAGSIRLAYQLLLRQFGMILAAGVIYMAVGFGVNMALSMIGLAINFQAGNFAPARAAAAPVYSWWDFVSMFINQCVSIFLALGLTRVGLDVVEGKAVRLAALFGGGAKWLGAVAGSVLLYLVVFLLPSACAGAAVWFAFKERQEPAIIAGVAAVVLLCYPGFYLLARYGLFMTAMVDRNLSVMDSFRESSRLSYGNKWQIVNLYILLGLINLGGMVAACVGLLFTIPLTTLAWYAAYKWMAHGPAALGERHSLPLA